jgi:hypothetical protein
MKVMSNAQDLNDSEYLLLLRPAQGQVDAIEQSLSTELSGLLPSADGLDGGGRDECEVREALDIAALDPFPFGNLGKGVHFAGSQLIEPNPRP